MGNWSYMSLDVFKADRNDVTTALDTRYRRALEGASALIDQYCERIFRTQAATRYYTAQNANLCRVDDLLSITSLQTDINGDGTYESTWAAGDYVLEPINALDDLKPYYQIIRPWYSSQFFTRVPRGVKVTGLWGYYQELELPGVTLAAAITTTTATTFTASAGGGALLDVLDTVLIDSEQLYITGISGDVVTVVRGVNGTTAATHLISAPVSRYRYPETLRQAAGLQAGRMFTRPGSPYGIVGSIETPIFRLSSRLDPDVQADLTEFRLVSVA